MREERNQGKGSVPLSIITGVSGKPAAKQVSYLKELIIGILTFPAQGKWPIDLKKIDEEAQLLLTLYWQAFQDWYFLPLLEKKDRRLVVKSLTDKKDKAERELDSKLAQEAIEFHRLLTASGTRLAIAPISQDEARSSWVDCPAYEKTRGMLLSEVARQWSESTDEEEASQCFTFLLKAANDRRYLPGLLEAVRKVNQACPLGRLVESIRCSSAEIVAQEGNRLVHSEQARNLEELYQLLVQAWAKKVGSQDVNQGSGRPRMALEAFKIAQHLAGTPICAWQTVADYAQRVSDLASLAASLVFYLSGKGHSYPPISGTREFSVRLLDVEAMRVEIDIKLEPFIKRQVISDARRSLTTMAEIWFNQNPGAKFLATCRLLHGPNRGLEVEEVEEMVLPGQS